MIKEKKAQEEMVGFVMIMVVVAIIFLVFLAIWIRQGPSDERVDSAEVVHFLDTILEYTTDCALWDPNYVSLETLIRYCREGGKICSVGPATGRRACDVLEETVQGLVESAWNLGPDSSEKSYHLKIEYTPSTGSPTKLIDDLGTSCPGSKRGADKPLSENVVVTLDLCQ